jgi:hypothetical protein
MWCPSGAKATVKSERACASISSDFAVVSPRGQMRTTPSAAAVAIAIPFGWKATAYARAFV